MLRKLFFVLTDFLGKMKKQNINAYAASTAFFFFLSFVPILILVCTILPYTPLTEQTLLMVTNGIVPEKIAPLLEGMIHEVYMKSAGLLSIAAVVTIWSAGQGVLALIRGLNTIQGVEDKRNYFLIRIVASLYTIAMLVAVLISLIILVFGNRLMTMILIKIPKQELFLELIMNLRNIPVCLVLTLILAVVYAYVPGKKQKLRTQIPGAFLAAVAWCVFSYGFSLYVDWADYSVYGNLSIIVLTMLWLYMGMYIIFIGAYINRYFLPANHYLFGRYKARKGNNALDKEKKVR